MKGIRRCYPQICHFSMKIILSWKAIKKETQKSLLASIPTLPAKHLQAGNKFRSVKVVPFPLLYQEKTTLSLEKLVPRSTDKISHIFHLFLLSICTPTLTTPRNLNQISFFLSFLHNLMLLVKIIYKTQSLSASLGL